MKNNKNKTLKKVTLIVISIVMVLSMINLSHPGGDGRQNHQLGISASASNAAPIYPTSQWVNNAASHIYDKWGRNTSNELDVLEYKSNLNFLSWYQQNYYSIPTSHRNFTRTNASIIIGMYQTTDASGNKLISEITQYEMSTKATISPFNTSYVVNHVLGKLVSNSTVASGGSIAHILVYKYHEDNSSLTYALLDKNGKITPMDPYAQLLSVYTNLNSPRYLHSLLNSVLKLSAIFNGLVVPSKSSTKLEPTPNRAPAAVGRNALPKSPIDPVMTEKTTMVRRSCTRASMVSVDIKKFLKFRALGS